MESCVFISFLFFSLFYSSFYSKFVYNGNMFFTMYKVFCFIKTERESTSKRQKDIKRYILSVYQASRFFFSFFFYITYSCFVTYSILLSNIFCLFIDTRRYFCFNGPCQVQITNIVDFNNFQTYNAHTFFLFTCVLMKI